MKKMKILEKINACLGKNKPLIETIGIIGGVFVLILTLHSTMLTRHSLELALKQDKDNQLPVWDWEINDSLSFVILHSTNPNIKIQMADAYFPKEIFGNSAEWALNQPDYKLHLNAFKSIIANAIRQKFKYDEDYVIIGDRGFFPLGLEINYIQYGTARNVKGIFAIQFTMIRSEEFPTIQIDGILFDHYLSSKQNLKETIDKLDVQF